MSNLEVKAKRVEVLDANDSHSQFRINIDVLNEAFGFGVSMYMRASYPAKGPTGGDWIPGIHKGEKFFIWMPKLFSNSSEWGNSISEDSALIYEIAEPGKTDDYLFSEGDTDPAFYMKRLAFVKESPKDSYRFAGVFIADEYNFKRHIFKRIATRVRLIGNPVTQIEILD